MNTIRITPLQICGLLAIVFSLHLHAQDTAKKAVVDYLWVDSDPTGAVVTCDGVEVGETPTVIADLAEGAYKLTFTLEGYQTLDKSYAVPNDGTKKLSSLDIQDGACVIKTSPSGATVYHENVLLGRTPLMLPSGRFRNGEHKFRMQKVGYDSTVMTIEIKDDEPNQLTVALIPIVGSIAVRMVPTGAVLYVDGKEYGELPATNSNTVISRIIRLRGFVPGKHRLQLHYAGQYSEVVTVEVLPGKEVKAKLLYWYPDATIKFKDGTVIQAMMVEEKADGSLVILTSGHELEEFSADQIVDLEPIDSAVAGKLAKKARIHRKMLRQEEAVRQE